MVDIPSARRYGLERLTLNESVAREVLNSAPVRRLLEQETEKVRAHVEGHVRATTSARSANNYVDAMFAGSSTSDAYGMDFNGPYALGNRPIGVVGITRVGPDPDAKPPFMVEAETHALTSAPGFTAGGAGEDVR